MLWDENNIVILGPWVRRIKLARRPYFYNLKLETLMKNIMLLGGGHCNCQVLKMLKKDLLATGIKAKMTLVNESPRSYYSGMLPGAVSSKPTQSSSR